MNDTHKKFVEDMLKKTVEKDEIKPQKRFESVDSEEVQKIVDRLKKGKRATDK